jgi:hypothetical protein
LADFIDVGVEVPVAMYLSGEPPILQPFDLGRYNLEEVRVSLQGMVQPVGHREDNVSEGAIVGGMEFNNVGHVFDTFPGGEAGDVSIWQLFDKVGLNSESFTNGNPDLDPVAIDDISLWRCCQCLLV